MERRNRIRRLRRHEGLTLKALAAEIDGAGLNCSESTLSRWENGSRPIPDPVKLFLAERFEVSVAYVMDWPDAGVDGNHETRRAC
jgi:transcriptional regulator with XRE-family HTH domain